MEGSGGHLSSSAGPSSGSTEGDTQITDLVRSTWAGTRETDALEDEDEEVTTSHSLERGLGWVQRAFDEIILPTTSVSLFEFGV